MKDVIVVGAGPVGSQVAKNFAEKGLDVLVIERSDEVGRPLACSGHVSPDIKNFLSNEEFDEIYQNEITGANFHTSGKEYSFYRNETVSYVIDRVGLDRKKAEQAREAGAEIKLGETVEKVQEKEDKVIVHTDEASYEGKILAGCDGASSTVRSEVGLPEPDHFYQGILCFTDEEDSSDFVDVVLDVPEFFGWRIPRGDSVEYGVGVPKGENPMKWLEKVTGKFDVEKQDRRDICAGAIPIKPPEKVSTERVFLAGDAAGQTKPFTGGGILYGMRAADRASETIDVDDPELERYEQAWRSELGRDIFLGGLIEKVYSMPSPVQRLGMWIFQGEIGVHMDRPSSLLSRKQLKAMLPWT
ncbi:geranylgeranyl reductase family protein [Candidatus Nanosalina sp. VS9-1]|uniref:geranylgeranyl reductase family protein n=1 Tax=Candidatus Nanosalina sp. VS9-1 TaxID=3388566 RepID=UPI0039E14A6F